jgi:hypothetical protein
MFRSDKERESKYCLSVELRRQTQLLQGFPLSGHFAYAFLNMLTILGVFLVSI